MAESAAHGRPRARRDPGTPGEQYPQLGTPGLTVSSDPRAEVVSGGSRLEGWVVAGLLLLGSCVAMAIYLVLLHR